MSGFIPNARAAVCNVEFNAVRPLLARSAEETVAPLRVGKTPANNIGV